MEFVSQREYADLKQRLIVLERKVEVLLSRIEAYEAELRQVSEQIRSSVGIVANS